MGYIGTKPSAVPLTSADITDGIIVNADISSTAGITLNKLSGNPNFRNIVINGDMQVAQRATSSASITTTGYYTLDRWQTFISSLGTWTMSQSTDVPSGYGFANSLKLDCTTADASPAASDRLLIRQTFEGQNLQYLKKGTANAVSLTASFWVKSTKTGTFILELFDENNTRSISKSYTVNVSNTWEFKTVTFDGDTTGAFTNNNEASLTVLFWLGAGTTYTSGTLATTWGSTTSANRAVGQVNIADSTSNDFLITGVQLEAGTSASDFEFLPYDVDLARCRRYLQTLVQINGGTQMIGVGYSYSTSQFHAGTKFDVVMRTAPSISFASGSYYYVGQGAGDVASNTLAVNMSSPINYLITVTGGTYSATGTGGVVFANSSANAFVRFDSEL